MAPPRQIDEVQWPPRSPRDVLLSTPGGRERLRQMASRTSPSPSPLKKSMSAAPRATASFDEALDGDLDDEDEDEETLQLRLQEIQARLKLKKLQNAKTKQNGEPAAPNPSRQPSAAPLSIQKRPAPAPAAAPSFGPVVIPASPVRKSRPEPPPQTSPRRVLLGIDKGLSGKDVSLKRAPSLRKPTGSQDGAAQHKSGHLQTSRTLLQGQGTGAASPARPLTFNERLAAARSQEADRKEKHDRVQQARTQSFGISKAQMDEFKTKAVTITDQQHESVPEFSREDIVGAAHGASATPAARKSRAKRAPEDVPESEASAFEPYSSLHLKKRNVPHSVLTRHFSGKKIVTMKDMLRDVKAPSFELPEYEQDIVFFAIVGRRSEPRAHKAAPSDKNGRHSDRGKYMVMTLVDLQFELELFLFDTGFERYWKISEGTVLAILNPSIMPPPRGREDTGRFSIVINSDADRVIEVGVARDLGFCTSVKKDGAACGSWVNLKRTQFCEYHVNEAVERVRKSRIEMSTFDGLGPPKRRLNSHDVLWGKDKEKADRPRRYDRETQTHWFASKTLSSADLIDGSSAFADRREREANLKRRLVAEERERSIMERLGRTGGGTGAEYMRQMHRDGGGSGGGGGGGTVAVDAKPAAELDAATLDLLALRTKDHKVHLGPAKRKRAESALSSASSSAAAAAAAAKSSTAFGWGGGLKDKLSRMKEGEKFRPESAAAAPPQPPTASSSSAASSLSADPRPVRKKTRFVTEKGIREAGRESLGDTLPEPLTAAGRRRMVVLDDDDDDDDLVILR